MARSGTNHLKDSARTASIELGMPMRKKNRANTNFFTCKGREAASPLTVLVGRHVPNFLSPSGEIVKPRNRNRALASALADPRWFDSCFCSCSNYRQCVPRDRSDVSSMHFFDGFRARAFTNQLCRGHSARESRALPRSAARAILATCGTWGVLSTREASPPDSLEVAKCA